MKKINIVVATLLLCSCCGEKQDRTEMEIALTGVVAAVANRYSLSCITLFYDNEQAWQEKRSVFLVSRYIAKDLRLLILTTTRRDEPKSGGCIRKLKIVLNWHHAAVATFYKAIQETPNLLSKSHWLVFLTGEQNTESFLESIYVPFNSALLIATLREPFKTVIIEEAYQVALGYPLRVSAYGSWNRTNFEAPPGISKYTRRQDLEGYPIRTSTKDDFPISSLRRDEGGNFFIGGYFGLVFYELAARTNFTPVYVHTTDNVTGSMVDGRWTGLIGMLQRREIDIAVGPLSIRASVMDVVELVWPLLASNYQIFFKQAGNVIEWNAILKPFGKFVWLSTVLWVVTGAVVMTTIFKIQCHYGNEQARFRHEFSPINSFLTLFKALCQQGSTVVPESLAGRVLYITSYLVSTILLTSYSAALISNLTVDEPLRPFDSLDSLLKDGSYRLIAIRRSTDYTYFSESSVPLIQEIYSKLMAKVPDEDLPGGKEDGIESVCMKDKYALFITAAVTQLTARQFSQERNCRILSLRTPLDKVFLTMGRQKGSPYAELVDFHLQAMDTTGILSKLRTQAWPLERRPSTLDFFQVTIEQVVQIYCILLVGCLAAIVVLYIEHLTYTWRHFLRCGQGDWPAAVILLTIIIIGICLSFP